MNVSRIHIQVLSPTSQYKKINKEYLYSSIFLLLQRLHYLNKNWISLLQTQLKLLWTYPFSSHLYKPLQFSPLSYKIDIYISIQIWVTCSFFQLSLHLDTEGVHLVFNSIPPHSCSVSPFKIHWCIDSSFSTLLFTPGYTPQGTPFSQPKLHTIVNIQDTLL